MLYEVLVNGQKVWEGEGPGATEADECFDREIFPEEFRVRPEKGSTDEVTLITGGEIVAVNRAEDAQTPEPEIVITGVGGVQIEDHVGSGG